MIPEKAIDEAWDKLHENPARPINITYRTLEAALEAAAPYMLAPAKADAWDEGSQARWDYQWRDDIEPLNNPYRSQS